MARLLELHGAVAPLATAAPSAGAPPPRTGAFHAGDAATLTIHATVEADDAAGATIRWPTKDELQQALGQQASVLADGAPAKADDALGVGHAEARSWPIQILVAPGEGSIGPVSLALVGADGKELDKGDVPAVAVRVETVLEPALARELDQRSAAQTGAPSPGGAPPGADLKAEMTRHLATPRGPWALQSRFPLGLILLLAGLVALAALVVWKLKRRPKRARPLPPPEPAEVVARRRLAALQASGLLGRGEHLAFHVELADILKQYLSHRLGTDIMELTTDEVRRMLRGEIRAQAALALGATARPGEVRNDILRVLTSCDVVKFARHAPPPVESLELLATTTRIVDLTTASLPAMASSPGAPSQPVPGSPHVSLGVRPEAPAGSASRPAAVQEARP